MDGVIESVGVKAWKITHGQSSEEPKNESLPRLSPGLMGAREFSISSSKLSTNTFIATCMPIQTQLPCQALRILQQYTNLRTQVISMSLLKHAHSAHFQADSSSHSCIIDANPLHCHSIGTERSGNMLEGWEIQPKSCKRARTPAQPITIQRYHFPFRFKQSRKNILLVHKDVTNMNQKLAKF